MYLTARVTTPPPPLILNFSLQEVSPQKAKEATGLTLLSRKRPEQLAEEHVFPIESRHKSPEIWELTKGRHKRMTAKCDTKGEILGKRVSRAAICLSSGEL